MKNYRDYDEFLKQFESHRERHEARGHLYREEGFEDLNRKYGTEYDAFDRMDNMSDPMNAKYNMYRSRYYERYWDTRENHAYYSLSMSKRAWLTFKKCMKERSLDPLYIDGSYYEQKHFDDDDT